MIHSTVVHGQSKAEEYLAGWQRSRAEYDNYRKRVLQEQELIRQRIKREVIQSLLSLSDSFQAVVYHLPAELANHNWVQGVQHVARQLETIMKDYGLTAIADIDVNFNPAIHEAVSQAKISGQNSGQVVEILQTGYRLGDEVIRPAKVKLAE